MLRRDAARYGPTGDRCSRGAHELDGIVPADPVGETARLGVPVDGRVVVGVQAGFEDERAVAERELLVAADRGPIAAAR